jgi:uncharacterized protein (DUF1778 family)
MPKTISKQRIPARMPTATLEEELIIKLSAASSEALFAMMENPPEPNEYLKHAMQRRQDTLCPK